MSLGAVREYAERLFACSPYTHRFFPCIPNTVKTFCTFGDDFEYRKQPYIRRILHIRLNTFRAFSEYA